MRISISKAWAVILLIALVLIDAAIIKSAYFVQSETDLQDGAFIQIKQTLELIVNGEAGKRALESPVFLSHLVRLAIFVPFSYLGSLGQGLEYVLIVFVSLPVVMRYYKRSSDLMLLAPLVLPFLISYRSFLAAVAIGYVVISVTGRGNALFLLFGISLSLLSSAVMVQSSLLMILYRRKIIWFLRRRPIVLVPLVAFLSITFLVVLVKIQGFAGGVDGYTSEYGSGGILSLVTRGTLFVGLAKGSLRGYVSLGIVLLLMFRLVLLGCSGSKKSQAYFRVLICLAPGVLFEGLGIVSMLFPIIWLVRGVDIIKVDQYKKGYIWKPAQPYQAARVGDDPTSV